jgi:hypothetical protein
MISVPRHESCHQSETEGYDTIKKKRQNNKILAVIIRRISTKSIITRAIMGTITISVTAIEKFLTYLNNNSGFSDGNLLIIPVDISIVIVLNGRCNHGC